MKVCDSCGEKLPNQAKFCSNCGADTESASSSTGGCKKCGSELKPNAQFCHSCGAKQPGAQGAKSAGPEGSSKPNLKFFIIALVFLPFLAGIFWLLSFESLNPVNRTNAPAANGVEAQPAMDMAQMERVRHLIDSLKTALTTDPADTSAMLFLGQMYEVANKTPEMRDYYQQFLALYPERTDIRLRVASAYFGEKNYFASQEELTKILDKDPDNAYALFYFGYTQHMLNNNESAREYWEKAIAADKEGAIADHARNALSSHTLKSDSLQN